jgi:hypothetical protein
VPAQVVGARVGDVDPLMAIEDALRTFPADELILVALAEEAANSLEQDVARPALQRFGLPVTHLVDDDSGLVQLGHARRASERQPEPRPLKLAKQVTRKIARGDSPWTGFLVQYAVFLIVLSVAALLVAIVLILYYGLV